MTKNTMIDLLKQIEKDIYVSSLESTFKQDSKSCAIHKAIEMLQAEPSVYPQKWIPVTERLPEDNLKVFVSTKTAVGIAAHNELGWYTPDTYFDGVIAWMPLPEPWKEGE